MTMRRISPADYREFDREFDTATTQRGRISDAACDQVWIKVDPPLIVRGAVVDCRPILVSAMYQRDRVVRFTVDPNDQLSLTYAARHHFPGIMARDLRHVVEAAALQDLSDMLGRAMWKV